MRRNLIPVLFGADPFAYRASWLHTIYVATGGNDTTGNGTKATPYKTLTKAMTVAVAGDGILVADGTYAENSDGGKYWAISKNLASWLIIEPELGPAGSVIITGAASATINTYFGPGTTSAYLKFRYLTFGEATGSSTILRVNATAISNIYFDHCNFTGAAATNGFQNGNSSDVTFDTCTWSGASYAIVGTPKGLTFTNCTIAGGAGANKAINCVTTTSTDAMTATGCTITGVQAISANGGTYTISNCTITGTGAVTAALFGVDSTTGNTTVVDISNCTITKNPAAAGHGLLLGAGCTTSHVDNITITAAYDYAVVLKEHTGTEIENCHLTGGSVAALYFKAVVSANAHHNTLTAGTGAYGFQLLKGDTGNKNQNWQFQNNVINVPNGKAINIGAAVDDAGGGICDYNQYQNSSGLGKCRADTNVANLTELVAAWQDYDVTTNDSHSTVV